MNELELVINEVKKAVVGKDEHIKKILACILAMVSCFIRRYTWCWENKFNVSTF